MSVATLRAAMGTALRTVDGLTNVTDYMTDEILPVHAMFDYSIEPHMVLGRLDQAASTYRFTIQVFATRSADRSSQTTLDLLRDPSTTTSLAYVVENDTTLAAACDYARVTSIGSIQIAQPKPGVEYLMVPFEVEVVL